MKRTTDIILIILVIGAIVICISSYNTVLDEEARIDNNTYYVSNNINYNNSTQATVNAEESITKIGLKELKYGKLTKSINQI